MRKKLTRANLDQVARKCKVMTLEEMDSLWGMKYYKNGIQFWSYDDFLKDYNSGIWNGGNVDGVFLSNYQVMYCGGETSAYISSNLMKIEDGETKIYDGGTDGSLIFHTYAQYEEAMDKGTWMGGFVDGLGYVSVTNTSHNMYNGCSESYLERARQYESQPYVFGGCSSNGLDCSGLVTLATGSKTRWTTSSGKPHGKWEKLDITKSSVNAFIQSLQVGDLLVWEGQHAAFYDGGKSLFHAHGSDRNGKVGSTNDLESYWLKNKGYPTVYRQIF